MKKKALITGATGFIGSNLVKGLIDDGWKVDVIVRPSSSLKMLSDLDGEIGVFEFNGETSSLLEIVSGSAPDVVFHVASLFLSEHKPEQIEELVSSNVLFGTQLLEAMSKAGVKSLLNTSTNWEHFENKEYSPVNLYAATKRAFADVLQFYVEARGMRSITLKLFDTYGPEDPRPKLFHLLGRIAESQEKLAMSPGEQLIDLVYIDDVIDAYKNAANRLLQNEVSECEDYAVSSGMPLPLRELVSKYSEIMGRELNIEWGGREYREREVMVTWSKGHPLPGWKCQVSLDEGIKRLRAAKAKEK